MLSKRRVLGIAVVLFLIFQLFIFLFNVGSSYLYGLEYHDSSWPYRLFDMSDVEGGTLHDYDIPCAVCVARSRYTQV